MEKTRELNVRMYTKCMLTSVKSLEKFVINAFVKTQKSVVDYCIISSPRKKVQNAIIRDELFAFSCRTALISVLRLWHVVWRNPFSYLNTKHVMNVSDVIDWIVFRGEVYVFTACCRKKMKNTPWKRRCIRGPFKKVSLRSIVVKKNKQIVQ